MLGDFGVAHSLPSSDQTSLHTSTVVVCVKLISQNNAVLFVLYPSAPPPLSVCNPVKLIYRSMLFFSLVSLV